MILSRFSLLILCFGICYAVDSSTGQDTERSEETMIFDLIYGCFEERGEDESPCDGYQRQIDCLKPFSYSHFVKELLEGLDSTVSIHGCPKKDSVTENEVDSSDSTTEVETNEIVESDHEIAPHHRERRMSKSLCQNYFHPRLDNACANWMFNNYHTVVNPGWRACSSFKYNYSKPCGWYWAKCKRANRNHHCCISVHCYGGLG